MKISIVRGNGRTVTLQRAGWKLRMLGERNRLDPEKKIASIGTRAQEMGRRAAEEATKKSNSRVVFDRAKDMLENQTPKVEDGIIFVGGKRKVDLLV